MKLACTISIAALVVASVAPIEALAWGAEGHRLVAELAEKRLTPHTRERVAELLSLEPGATLVSISTWADEIRSPETARWHYVNLPRDANCLYRAERDCKGGDCVVSAIDTQLKVLASGSATPEAKLLALKYVVHFVGDVHQPLHSAFGDDRGGNQYQVQAFGRGTNLHSLWDSALIANWPGGIGSLRTEVEGLAPTAQGASVDWAQESCRIASTEGFYPARRTIDADYVEASAPTVRARLRAAADRLAAVLNGSLQPRSP